MPRGKYQRPTRLEYFMRHVIKLENGCWQWTGHVLDGYGIACTDGRKTMSAHKLSFILFKGPISPGKEICHTCDFTLCVCPEHLYDGTHLNNMEDMSLRFRTHSTLTIEQVLAIRNDPRPSRQIAKDYGRSHVAILFIKKGKTFRHAKQKSPDR